jgi:DNA polymerase III epsilon subunit-like protein
MITFRGRRLALTDLEASALSGGYPTEIGVCSDPEIGYQSSLIRPVPEWAPLLWDPESEAITKISREMLAGAPSPAEVCDLFERWVGDAMVVVEHLPHDGPWIDQIYEAAGRKRLFGLYDFHDVLFDLVVEHGRPIENVYGACDVIQSSHEKPHRAGPDVVLMAKVLKLALDPNFNGTPDHDAAKPEADRQTR